ncbi:LSU ribosomal protein L1p (L10Ae) [hydrothermal vent metagenome]|uniref:LSU ribosomal protein L1p (L10Ae) n=1 Tax=hydrothermal vent metagenome TaxID=652676 RepID=A0A3B1BH86_9ZZZZ
MPGKGKRYKDAAAQRDQSMKYKLFEALDIVKNNAKAKFDETVEIAVRLGVDPTKADQMVRGALTMPKGTGKSRTIAVFAKGDKVREAEEAGANVVGGEDLVKKIQGGWLEFDVAVATPDMMGQVGKIGRLLGPRGLMPNPKSGTVTFDLKQAINEIQAGKVEFRVDKAGVVHAPIGKASFTPADLLENAKALIGKLQKMKPSTAKGTYVRSIGVSSTMGPGVKVDTSLAGISSAA